MTKLSKDSPESAILGLGFGTVWVTTELRVKMSTKYSYKYLYTCTGNA